MEAAFQQYAGFPLSAFRYMFAGILTVTFLLWVVWVINSQYKRLVSEEIKVAEFGITVVRAVVVVLVVLTVIGMVSTS